MNKQVFPIKDSKKGKNALFFVFRQTYKNYNNPILKLKEAKSAADEIRIYDATVNLWMIE